jgi:hypothetical protein
MFLFGLLSISKGQKSTHRQRRTNVQPKTPLPGEANSQPITSPVNMARKTKRNAH